MVVYAALVFGIEKLACTFRIGQLAQSWHLVHMAATMSATVALPDHALPHQSLVAADPILVQTFRALHFRFVKFVSVKTS